MAILNSFLLGQCSGRVGNLVLYQCRGKTYVRSCGKKSTKPASLMQLQQRERMGAVFLFYRSVREAGLYGIWQKAAEKLRGSGYSLFVQKNVRVFTGEGLIRDFAKVCLSVGTLELPDLMTIRREPEGGWVMEWQQRTPWHPVRETDRLVVALMIREEVYAVKVPSIGEVYRKDYRAVIRLPAKWAGYSHLYCFFRSATGEEYSESRYFDLSLI